VLALRVDVYLLDAAAAAIVRRVEVPAPAGNRVAFEPWIGGWQGDAVYLKTSGCPGEPGAECRGPLVQQTWFRIGPAGAEVVAAPPALVLAQIAGGPDRFLGASRDAHSIAVATDQSGPYRPVFRIEGTRLVPAGAATAR
jgi:hypothetical protein